MPDIAAIIEAGGQNAWLLLPAAITLGALHALEPGHSKSMMTAFIVAINGTARQAALLALSATVGHTIVVWILALIAWRLGDGGFLEKAEPWLLLIGGLLIVALAIRMLMRLAPGSGVHARHGHGHNHGHDHNHPHDHSHDDDDHYDGHAHSHGRSHSHSHGPLVAHDAHAAAHEAEIKSKFTRRPVTNSDVMWFGFSGGLLPCPAAFAVLLACLHQKAYALGLVMVAAFSLGLALMLVAIGVGAAWGAEALKSRSSGFGRIASWAPVLSAIMILVIGAAVAGQGARALGWV
jgi:nickel/cobalt transporter (NicO) family protein